jgi:gluconate 5-dehydrogenase
MPRVLLITGASRGIGRAIAEAYAAEGATLCLMATDTARLDEVKDSLGLPADQVMTVGVNVTDREACFRAVDAVTARFGRVDVLVNNAGVYRSKSFLEYSTQDFQDMLDVNLFGVLHFMQACLPSMQERKHGRIINMASTAGKWGSRNQSAYNVSKHAVVGLTRCVALEASPYKVTVNAICPGFFPSKMTAGLMASIGEERLAASAPLQRLGDDEDLKGLCLLFASDAGKHITGQWLAVDGGASVVGCG